MLTRPADTLPLPNFLLLGSPVLLLDFLLSYLRLRKPRAVNNSKALLTQHHFGCQHNNEASRERISQTAVIGDLRVDSVRRRFHMWLANSRPCRIHSRVHKCHSKSGTAEQKAAANLAAQAANSAAAASQAASSAARSCARPKRSIFFGSPATFFSRASVYAYFRLV